MTAYLDLEDLLAVAADAISGQVLVRDYGLLESALARPKTTVFGEEAYPSIHGKATALLHSLVRNRALVDGNKRLAWLATFVFLDVNGHRVRVSQDAVVDLVAAVADGTLDEVNKITEQLQRFSEHSDRP